jgi:hypothetical protein
MRRTVVLALVVASFLVATISFAEDTPKAVAVVSLFKVLPGKGDDVTSFFTEIVGPVLNKPLADGAIFGCGLLMPVVHVADAPTHFTWYLVSTLAEVDKVQAALRGAREKRSKEQNAAFEARAQEIFESGTHSDDLLQVTMSAAR